MASDKDDDVMPIGRVARKMVFTFIALTIAVGCLTVMFLSMRAVMEIGGSCASGGPYVVANPCPKGVGWIMPVSIWVGLISVGFYVGNSDGLPGPQFAVLAWPALFLSLGWNFWEYALGSDGGIDIGFIICGVVFVAMGLAPLVAVLWTSNGRRMLLWSDPDGTPVPKPDKPGTVRLTAETIKPRIKPPKAEHQKQNQQNQRRSTPDKPSASGAITTVAPLGITFEPSSSLRLPDAAEHEDLHGGSPEIDGADVDLAEDLALLAELHRKGDLTDTEYRDAKAQRMIGGRG